MDDLTFEGTGESAVQAVEGEPVLLRGLAVHDHGAGLVGDDLIWITVGVENGWLDLDATAPGTTLQYGANSSRLEFHGTAAEINADLAHVTYTSYNEGTDQITISGVDGNVYSATYFVGSINISPPPNNPPIAGDDQVVAASTAFDTSGGSAVLSLHNDLLLLNDSDADGDATFIDTGSYTPPTEGTVSHRIDFTEYTLSDPGDLPNSSGPALTDSFTYAATDLDTSSNAATVSLTVVGAGAALTDTSGDTILIGGIVSGSDTFVFAADSGHDTIVNFVHGEDAIDLVALGFTEISNDDWLTQHTFDDGIDTYVRLDDLEGGRNTIQVKGATGLTALTASDFILHPGV